MERIRDLLNPSSMNLQIRESPEKGIYIDNVKVCYVGSPDELLQYMEEGSHNRVVAATGMNEGSSRSHSILFLYTTQTDVETCSVKKSKLCLVDLAGSEMVNKTNAAGQTLEEAKMINKSLSTLGLVINSLTDNKSSHIPYRDSKLTRVLQESLGGNSMTTLIICCSPSSYNAAETLSTLRFGQRAKRIKNKPIVNEQKSVRELENLLAQRDEAILLQENRLTTSLDVIYKQRIHITHLNLNIQLLLLDMQGCRDEKLEEKILQLEEDNPFLINKENDNIDVDYSQFSYDNSAVLSPESSNLSSQNSGTFNLNLPHDNNDNNLENANVKSESNSEPLSPTKNISLESSQLNVSYKSIRESIPFSVLSKSIQPKSPNECEELPYTNSKEITNKLLNNVIMASPKSKYVLGVSLPMSATGVEKRRAESRNSIDTEQFEIESEIADRKINLPLIVADYSRKNKMLEEELNILKREYDDYLLLMKEKEAQWEIYKYIYIII